MDSLTLNGRAGKGEILLRDTKKLVYKRKWKILLNGEECHLGARYSLVMKKINLLQESKTKEINSQSMNVESFLVTNIAIGKCK